MAASIGTAWIQIKPSLVGISKDIEEQLGGPLDKTLGKGKSSFSKFSAHGIEALNKIGKFGFTALATTAVATLAFIGSRIGSAVNRIDTLLSFPRVLEAMGASSDEASGATDRLAKSLQGLPTALQDGARGVQQLVVAGLDVPRATDAFLALNNSLIASGAGAAQVDSAMLAMSQALSRGKIEGNEWNSLLATMPAAFGALQKETGLTTQELRDLFQEDPRGLIDKLITLNKVGGEGFASLETQARQATGGIGTAWSNLGNAVDRGWQAMLTAIGGGSLENGAKKVSDIITGLGKSIETVMKSIGEWINNNGPLINDVIIPALRGIGIAIGLITAGFMVASIIVGGWVSAIIAGIVLVSAGISILVQNWEGVIQVLTDVWNGFTQFFIDIGVGVAELIAGVVSAFGGLPDWFSNTFSAAWESIKLVFAPWTKFFTGLWTAITSVFGKVGTAIGDSISGAVKGVVNSILGFAENVINGFIKAINLAISAINAIPGVDIGKLALLNIPRLATGGPVFGAGTATSDSIPAMLSDGEYVIRAAAAREIGYGNLDQLNETGRMTSSFTMGDIIIQGYNRDPEELAEIVSKKIALKRAKVIG